MPRAWGVSPAAPGTTVERPKLRPREPRRRLGDRLTAEARGVNRLRLGACRFARQTEGKHRKIPRDLHQVPPTVRLCTAAEQSGATRTGPRAGGTCPPTTRAPPSRPLLGLLDPPGPTTGPGLPLHPPRQHTRPRGGPRSDLCRRPRFSRRGAPTQGCRRPLPTQDSPSLPPV